ncbi:MAG: efflux RND transporter periplasmic adaptor subunit [Planctomycetes bacterium]|nr:efflux RND transporter periplasmic adaptor subunit [Planctomycetota bacterium]
MTNPVPKPRGRVLRKLARPALAVAVLAAMTLLVLWLSGFFGARIPATAMPRPGVLALPAGTATTLVQAIEVPVREEAVGTIRAQQEVELASRLLARVTTMNVARAGQAVKKGEVLVELEDQDLRARLLEAQAAQRSAEETRQQAERDLARTRELHAQKIASDRDLERDTTRLANATAEAERAEQAANAAETTLAFAVIRSPLDGVVIDKLVEQGDTVAPGQTLMKLYDPSRMQLVASVREQLATRLKPGEEVAVAIDALGLRCHGTVAEIVPLAASGSRTFDVKVTGPCPDGVFTGMFGRLFVELGTRREIRVPQSAVRSIGQIDSVFVVRDGSTALRRFVVLGEHDGDSVAVLSGLADGETIVTHARALREAGER